MKAQWTLLLIGGLSAWAPALARGVDLQPMVVTNLTGDLHIEQSLPLTCDDVDQTTAVIGGRLEITPAEGVDVPGGKSFALTRANVFFAPFTVHRSCFTESVTRAYTEVGVQVNQVASFVATPAGPGVFAVTIPKEDVLLFQAATVNGEPETGYKRPKEDITGTIDFQQGRVDMRVVVATKVHIEALCAPVVGCAIDDDYDGTLTATLFGTIVFPDTDGDGVPNRSDTCPLAANPSQGPVASPIVRPPAAATLASCADDRIGRAVGADLCRDEPVTVTNDAPSPFPLGATTVTWRVQDTRGQFATAPQTVTVVDTTPPVFTFVPPDLSLLDCISPDLGQPQATDDCGGSPTFSNDAPPKFLVGTTVVTWTATDLSGNHATATQTVTVIDTVPPEVSCVPSSPPGGTFRVSGTDHCTDAPVLRLGGFVLANGEEIKINETGQSGVRLIGVVGRGGIRHFHVGRGEAVITATDPSGNTASAGCSK